MVWTPSLSWVFREIPTATKLNQMIENLRVHDHRSDGSQGASLVGAWVTASGVSAGAGWSLGTVRYRLLAGQIMVDVNATRTGAALTGADVNAATPGNVGDSTILTGWPTAARPDRDQIVVGNIGNTNPGTVAFGSAGTLVLAFLSVSAPLSTGDTLVIRGSLWQG